MAKIKKYTEGTLVRLDKKTRLTLEQKCLNLEIDEAVYGRKAIELCLRKDLINSK
jgi:hypothetical protein